MNNLLNKIAKKLKINRNLKILQLVIKYNRDRMVKLPTTYNNYLGQEQTILGMPYFL